MKYLRFFLIFGSLGTLGASFIGPKVITWYFTPPIQAYLNCGPATTWAMEKLIIIQLLFFVFFGILGFVIAFKVGKKETPKPLIPG